MQAAAAPHAEQSVGLQQSRAEEQAQDDAQGEQQQAVSSDAEGEGVTAPAGPEVQADADDVLHGSYVEAEEVRELLRAQAAKPTAGPRRSSRLQATAKVQAEHAAHAKKTMDAIDERLAEQRSGDCSPQRERQMRRHRRRGRWRHLQSQR
jgi:hypothetical protein